MKRKHPLTPTHEDIEVLVTEWLDTYHICYHPVPNKGRWDYGQDKKKPGAPDFIAVIHGLYLGIEIKTEGKKQSPAQKEFQAELEQRGEGIYLLVRDIEDLQPLLNLKASSVMIYAQKARII